MLIFDRIRVESVFNALARKGSFREVERFRRELTNERSKVDNQLVPNNRFSNPISFVPKLSIVSSRCPKFLNRVFQTRYAVESNEGSLVSRERGV